MDFSNIIGVEIYHKLYGYVTITNVEVDYYDLSNAKIITEGKDDLEIRKFYVKTLDKFFVNLPQAVSDVIKLVKETISTESRPGVYVNKNLSKLSWYELDENNNNITIEEWEQSKQFVISFQYSNTNQKYNIPIVMDNSKLFINVIAACAYLGESVIKSRGIYSVCNGTESRTKYIDHKWRYATVKDIDFVINQIKGEVNVR